MTTIRNSRWIAAVAILAVAAVPALAGHHESKDSSYGASKDIVAVAAEAGSFNTLVAALQAAGLVDALKGDGPLTVFAPTDEAFAKLPEGTVENLLKPENVDQLKAVLTYHVVAGELKSGDVTSQNGATTLQGQDLAFKATDGMVMVGNAHVVKADIGASNGVIHVIDTVLLPN